MKKVLALVLAMVTSMSLVACGGGADTAGSSGGASGSGEEKTVTLSLAHIRPVDSSADIAIRAFADEATELSDGTDQFDIYPASQLGEYTTVRRESALVT